MREEIVAQVFALPLQHEPGTQVVYSDLGFIVLGELAARLLAEPLEQAARTHVLQPLGMLGSGYRPLPQAAAAPESPGSAAIAPTEWDEAGQAYRIGTVHDENASAMGGVSGHAGLFSTARDLSRYASMWLNEGVTAEGTRFLSVPTVRAALCSHTGALSTGHRGLGWVLKGDSFDASGDLLSERSYGHTGFTGTSLYVDPEYGLTITLLTNRVHYGRSKSVASLRARFHNAIAASLCGKHLKTF
jgi:CubicO group peptidase (beta-lactamase class C family)